MFTAWARLAVTPWTASGSPMMSRTFMRGLSEEKGSWKTTCMRRRSGRSLSETLQALRAPFRNPIGEFVATLTNWAVLPARRVTPGLFGLDLASLVLAFALLVPGPFVYRIGMIALLLIPLVYFEIALMSIYRRHLLTSNGLDGSLIDVKRQARREVTRSEYEANYPRTPD